MQLTVPRAVQIPPPPVEIPAPRPAPDPTVEVEPAEVRAPKRLPDGTSRAVHRLWRTLTGLLLIAAAVASVTAMVTVMSQHLGFAPVLSPSMEPAFHPGDLVVTKPEPASAVKVGQVVALPVPDAPGQRYVHRIISVSTKNGRPLVQTKGDANPEPEPFSLRIDSPTVPVVVATVPELGRLSVLLQHSRLRLAVTAITVLAMLLAAWRMFLGARPRPGNGKHAQ